MKKKYKKELDNIKCECGYHNHKESVQRYGTCKGCGKVLDEKAKFHYELFCKLNLWRYKRH